MAAVAHRVGVDAGDRARAWSCPAQSAPARCAQTGSTGCSSASLGAASRQQGRHLGPRSLASGGTLGGSQAGARLTYNFTRRIAATLRTTQRVGRRGGEVAAGVRIQPLGGIPVWLTAERRQRSADIGGGRNAFALFVEGGVYQRPMPWQFSLDAYLQGGVVGFSSRDSLRRRRRSP